MENVIFKEIKEKLKKLLKQTKIKRRVDKFTSRMYRNLVETKEGNIVVKENLINSKTDKDLVDIIEILLYLEQNPETDTSYYITNLLGFSEMLNNL